MYLFRPSLFLTMRCFSFGHHCVPVSVSFGHHRVYVLIVVCMYLSRALDLLAMIVWDGSFGLVLDPLAKIP